jgi:hypothetical protein
VPELSPIPSPQRPSDPGYQPVSAYAVAAAVAAGVFVVILIVLLIAAITSQRAPMWIELLLIPAVGWILAIIARNHVRNSEGTRTGARLAARVWWVCVLGGAAFFAYWYANQVVLDRESRKFADGFFNELRNGRQHHAFVYLLAPEDLHRATPDVPDAFETAYLPSGWAYYKNHEMVRLILRNGTSAEFEHMGTKDVDQVATGFQATHLYRLRCPEGEFNIQVKLTAAEAKQGGKSQLKWHIPADPYPNFSIKPEKISTYGRLLTEMEQEGSSFASTWAMHTTAGRTTLAHLMTMPLAHRQPLELQLLMDSLAGGSPAALFPLRLELLPPERRANEAVAKASPATLAFEDLLQSGFFRMDAAGTPLPSEKVNRLRSVWVATPRVEATLAVRQLAMTQVPPDSPTISVTPDVVTVIVGIEIGLESAQQYARGSLAVECREPEVLALLTKYREQGTAGDDLVSLQTLPNRGWRVAWLRTDMEAHSVGTGPMGMTPSQ